MRKAVMGLGGLLIVVGVVVLILSIVTVGGIVGQVDQIDAVISDATGSVTEVGGVLESVAGNLAGVDASLAAVEEPVAEFTGTVAALNDAAAEWFEMGEMEVTADDLDSIGTLVETAGLDATWFRSQADLLRQEGFAWSVTGEDVSSALAPIVETLEAVSGGISEARGVLTTTQAGLSGFGAELDTMAASIEGMNIGGMVGGVVGFLQTYLILSSILFIAGGAGLFLLARRE